MNIGAFGENFPYSNFHDLNMDWIIKIAKDFLDQYTHIQEIIETGTADIQNLTETGLADLQNKYDVLEALLQDWYNSHSNDIADQLADALNDLNEWYTLHQNYLDDTLTAKIASFNLAADRKAAETIASIPDDYTSLTNHVNLLDSNAIADAVKNGLIFNVEWSSAEIHDMYFTLAGNTPVKVKFISTTNSDYTDITVYGVKSDNTIYTLGTVPLGQTRIFYTRYTNDSIRLTATPYTGSTNATFVCSMQVGSVTQSLLDVTNYDHVSHSNNRTVFEKRDIQQGEKYKIYIWDLVGAETANVILYLFMSDNTRTVIPQKLIGNTKAAEVTIPANASFIRVYGSVGTTGTQMSYSYAFVKIGGGLLNTIEHRIANIENTNNALLDITDKNVFTFTHNRSIYEKNDISAGETYRIYVWKTSTDDNSTVTAYLFYTDSTYESIPSITENGTMYFEITVPTNADFIRLYGNVGTDGTPMTVEYIFVKIGGKILDAIGVTEEIKLFACRNSTLTKIFRKVCCCGDSYTAGYIDIGDGSSTYPNYTWSHFMQTATGNEYVNCGVSGANVFTWMAHQNGLAKARNSGKAQLYIIDLIRNDASNSDRHVDVGTPADIGTEANTYYGGMSKLIRELNSINPTAKIFVNCVPSSAIGYKDYNTAIRTIVQTYRNTYPVHCIDLEKFKTLFLTGAFANDRIHGHETGIGYEVFAELYMAITSNYIKDNIALFQNVHEIPVQ